MSTEAQPAMTETTAPTTSGPDIAASGPATGAGAADTKLEGSVLGPGEGKTSTKGTAEAVPNLVNVPKEEKIGKNEVLVESNPINEGVLNYKGQGLKGLIFSKKYFWFSDGPLDEKHLSAYIGNEKSKDVAHGNAAHATQTGKGLLFFAKRAEDKNHPQGILNLADMTDLAKGNFNDFTATLHGHKHTFQAQTKGERDGWLVAMEPKMADAVTSREGITGSEGYKSQFEKYGKPAAVAGATNKARSLSRPNKASKSRERAVATSTTKDAAAAKDPKVATPVEATPAAATSDPTPAVNATETNTPATAPIDASRGTNGEHAARAAAAAAPAGAAVAAGTRKGSASDEDKKDKKGRSHSRGNKRTSIFGGLLGKKEEKKDDSSVKKAEKEEEKAIKNEVKKEEKAEKKSDKAFEHEVKKEEKAEKKHEKAEIKEEQKIEKEADKVAAKHDHDNKGIDAAGIAARVMGEPEVPGSEAATKSTSETLPSEPIASSTTTETPTAVGTIPTTAITATRDTAAKPNKRMSMLGGFFGKRDSATSPSGIEKGPAVPAKDEQPTVSPTAPQLDNPVTSPTLETASPAAGTAVTEPVANTDGAAATSATTPTDKRRTSFFGNLGTKKEKRAGATSGDELTDSETKKQSGGFGGLLRKASRAQPKKESKVPVADAAEGSLAQEKGITGTTAAASNPIQETEQSLTNGGAVAKEDQPLEHKPALSEGETAGANALTKSEETPAVASTA